MIKNIVFDLGRVIYTYQPREYLLNLGYDETQADKLMKCIFNNPLWLDIDRGLYSVREGMEKMCADFPAQADDIRRVLDDSWMDRMFDLMPESLDFFYEVKKRGYKIYILSNFGADSFAHIRERDAFFFNEADGIVVSAYEKYIKPEPEIYYCLLNRYALIPEETLFIDDNYDNITAAKALGIHGIVFTDITDCRILFNIQIDDR